MPTLDDLIAEAEQLHKQQQAHIKALKAFRALQSKSGSKQLKHPDGKLTDEGVRHLHAGFAAGKTPTELARSLSITVPAVLYRRTSWETGRRRRK